MAHAHESKGSGTTVLMIIAVALVAFAGGYFIGTKSGDTAGEKPAEMAEAGAAAGDLADQKDSQKIPVGDSYTKGKATAPITIVEFSDFQCPFCSRGASTLDELYEKYPNDIRLVFKHFPLAFHKEAPGASKAALAAGEQGKFWEMHDLLFQKQKEYKGADMKELTSGYAKQLGLDVQKFQKDFDNPKYDEIIKKDMQVGQSLGVRGTPHFFVNGERVSGAQPISKFEEIVKRQLTEAKAMLTAGVKRDNLYAKMVEKNYESKDAKPEAKKGGQQKQVVEYIPIRTNDPVKGAKKDYLVTMVEFSDFQCPFCTRVNPTIDQLMKNYGDKLRVIFKQNPLPFHKQADAAAQAALAAGKQGKFWEMHDLLFEKQKEYKTSDMKELTTKLAQQLGLNVAKFQKDYDSAEIKNMVKEDKALAQKVGARGTPNFFVNGVQVVGAKPYPAFEEVVKAQIAKAEKLKKEKNLSGEALYKAVVELNKQDAPAAAPAAPAKPDPKIDTSKLKVGDSYTKGSANAPVTIWEFSDFQCPYCKRGADVMDEILPQYKGKVRLVFKAFPLPFHKEAEPAHRAAIAAGKQGKFWEYHDLAFANQKGLKDLSNLVKWAEQLGLNIKKFQADMDSEEVKQQVQDEMAMGKAVGVRGTPNFVINDQRLVGAQPAAKFKEIIDAQLKGK